jgi:hypothetical protein
MKVPNSIEDAFIPMETADIKTIQEQRKKRDQYWAMLYQARQDFLFFMLSDRSSLEYDPDPGAFFYYLKQNYGLQVATVDGQITGDYAVIDEKKYLLFLLKYSQ